MRRYLPLAITAGVAVALQLAIRLLDVPYLLTPLTMSVSASLVVLGLCLLMGYAGQISLGHAGFCAIGGYTSALLTTVDLGAFSAAPAMRLAARLQLVASRTDALGTQITTVAPWLAAPLSLALAGAVALAIGIPTLRLRGHYLAMATLGFGLIVNRLLLGIPALGGADGISGVPPLRFLGLEVSGRIPLRVECYYLACAAALVALFLSVNLTHSRAGRALRAIHDSEEAARAMGVDTSRSKLAVFVLSALLAAASGVYLAHYAGGVGPSEASTMRSIRWVSIVAVGGMGSIWGALASAVTLSFLSLRGVFGTLDDAVFGAILVAVMVFSPRGLPGVAAAIRSFARAALRGRRARRA